MVIFNVPQQSPEWFSARLGIPSASNFDKIITTSGAPSKQAQKYMYRLAGEYVSGIPEESYQSAAMLRGIELEPEARSLYEIIMDTPVIQAGFCMNEEPKYGCSVDGFVGDDGIVEIKCLSLSVHVEYLLGGLLPTEFFTQVQGQLLVTGRKWNDLILYYPAIKPLIVRVVRDEEFIGKLKAVLEDFCEQLQQTIKKIGD